MKRIATLSVLGLMLASLTMWAQEPDKQKSEPAARPIYRLDYVITELQDGKVVNHRTYTLFTQEGEKGALRMGDRVPIPTTGDKGGQYTYLDVGVNLDAKVWSSGAGLLVHTQLEVSGFDGEKTSPPLVRQWKIEGYRHVERGKPVLVSGADEPSGSHRFEVQLTLSNPQ